MTTERPSRTSAPAPTPRPKHAAGGFARLVSMAFQPFWVVPALWCVAAIVLGVLLPELDEVLAAHVPFVFQAGPDGARTLLSTIAGAMISVTGLVFSITIIVLQLASSQFSPRVLRTFLDDRVPQMTLGVFTATFVYALTVLRSVYGDNADVAAFVPQLAITFAFLLVLAAVAMFLAFIQHITSAISVETLVRQVRDETRQLIDRSADRREHLNEDPPILDDLGDTTVVAATRSGYLDYVRISKLRNVAMERDVRIEVLHPLGTFVAEGAPVAMVHGGGRDTATDWHSVLAGPVGVSKQRSMEQDISFGFRQLVDIGERALSPGVNDPTTATQVIDGLHDLLRRIADQADLFPVHYDDGVARLVTTEWSFGDYLDLAVDELAHWGAGSLQVPARLDLMLQDLATVATPRNRRLIEAKRHEVQARAEAERG